MFSRKFVSSLALFAMAATTASAADWDGSYIGGNLGYARGDSHVNTRAVTAGTYFAATSVTSIYANGRDTINPDGFTGGIQAGRNWKSGTTVYGIEADFNSFRVDDSRAVRVTYPCCAPTDYTIRQKVDTDWLLTVRPRIGVLTSNNLLLYVTAGLAVTNLKYHNSFRDTFPTAALGASESASTSQTRYGGTIGGGAEYKLTGNWTGKVEYLYTDFGSVKSHGTLTTPLGATAPFSHSADLKAHQLRVGFNYQF